MDHEVEAARGLWWITLDKQVCAKIVLVQTDHSKYCQTCLGLCLGSACFEGKQWSDTHTQPFPVGGHICSMFSCSYDLGSLQW